MKYYILIASIALLACTSKKETKKEVTLDDISFSYIKLALEVGQYHPGYIDAYYGPDSLKPKDLSPTEQQKFPSDSLRRKADNLLNSFSSIDQQKLNDLEKLRFQYLHSQLSAVRAYIRIKGGKKMSFDEEAKALYEANPPTYSTQYFDSLVQKLDSILPGKGDVAERLEKFRSTFIIPKEKLDTVFKVAIAESRRRTAQQIHLPEKENFEVEFVTNKPWSGYNWFKGNAYSLIQVNTDLPIFIDRAIDLACHEGYPGHHVYHLMLEENLVNKKKWWEYTVYPLFSPQGMISEGSANYGIDVAFPGAERISFEKKALFPLIGLDSSKAEQYYTIQNYTKKLSYAGNEAARAYLDGKITKEQAAEWLHKYGLMSPERAAQRVSFIETYRSYVINYNLGQDMIKNYIEKRGGINQTLKKDGIYLEKSFQHLKHPKD